MEDTIKREDAKRYFTEFLSLNRFADFKKANIERLVGKLCERIPSAEPKQEWIPCSERLPTLNEDGVSDMVLLCWSDGQRTVGAYRGDRTFVGQAWPAARDCRVTVIAWMALPEPWEGVDDNEEI